MDRTPVQSSNLASVGYDEFQELLEVEFLNGRIYRYFGVPEEVYEKLMNADSHGSYFHKAIRDEFPYDRII